LLFYDNTTVARIDEFDYHLPEDLIAQTPLPDRSASRMLVLYRAEKRWEDRAFSELPRFLHPGDCLILNDSKVFPSRLLGTRASGTAAIEVFLLRPLSPDQLAWEALVRPGRKAPLGERLQFEGELSAEIVSRGDHGQRTLRFSGSPNVSRNIMETLWRIGHVPLPPYIRRRDTLEDRARYQTVYAEAEGSVAAPTAGLHFTDEMLSRCRDAGAAIATVTLHVGLGTFQPLHGETLDEVDLHSERYSVSPGSITLIQNAQRRIAVGTTSVRAIESAARYHALAGETKLFLSPGDRFYLTDALLTNFHLPRSSLLILVSAFAGTEFALAAYRHAVSQRYRFYSYGDCMLIV